MILEKIEVERYNFTIFNKSTDEWKYVQSLCLAETDNWLIDNYTEKNCIVEDHDIFSIGYTKDTNEPVFFGGIYNNGRYDHRVARALNRFYVFPNFRKPSTMQQRLKDIHDSLIPLMQQFSLVQRDLLFISMQMRKRDYKGEQRWWAMWRKMWMNASVNWIGPEGLVKVTAGEQPTAYQNIVYKDSENFRFSDWNPKIISFEEFHRLQIKTT
jgi:hypothetical protein